jgi:hypothetical protein
LTHLVDDGCDVVLLGGRGQGFASSNTISSCATAFLRFFGLGMGVMNSARLRLLTTCWVG